MKAVVMESNNGRSIVLTDDGVFVEIDGSYEAGQVINYEKWKPAKAKRKSMRNITAAACLILALLIGAVSVTSPSTYAYVELGEDYSVRYLLDKDLKVIDVQASEESGRELADGLKAGGIKGKDIDEAISMTEDLSGRSYNALDEPPEIRCKDDSAGELLADRIREHHSPAGEPEEPREQQGGNAKDANAAKNSVDAAIENANAPDMQTKEDNGSENAKEMPAESAEKQAKPSAAPESNGPGNDGSGGNAPDPGANRGPGEPEPRN